MQKTETWVHRPSLEPREKFAKKLHTDLARVVWSTNNDCMPRKMTVQRHDYLRLSLARCIGQNVLFLVRRLQLRVRLLHGLIRSMLLIAIGTASLALYNQRLITSSTCRHQNNSSYCILSYQLPTLSGEMEINNSTSC